MADILISRAESESQIPNRGTVYERKRWSRAAEAVQAFIEGELASLRGVNRISDLVSEWKKPVLVERSMIAIGYRITPVPLDPATNPLLRLLGRNIETMRKPDETPEEFMGRQDPLARDRILSIYELAQAVYDDKFVSLAEDRVKHFFGQQDTFDKTPLDG